MLIDLPNWFRAENPNWIVIVIGTLTVALEAWMICEAIVLWPKAKGLLEEALPPLSTEFATEPTDDGGRSC